MADSRTLAPWAGVRRVMVACLLLFWLIGWISACLQPSAVRSRRRAWPSPRRWPAALRL